MENSLVASTEASVERNNLANEAPKPVGASLILCPECKEGQVIPEGRCKHCLLCGWSACSI